MDSIHRSLVKIFEKRYPHDSQGCRKIKHSVVESVNRFLKMDATDKNTFQKLSSDNFNTYWQILSEVAFAELLWSSSLNPSRSSERGPDFFIENGKNKIWIEVITPEPIDIPNNWINRKHTDDGSSDSGMVPHEKILLRWTAAIKEKFEKLKTYQNMGVVRSGDIYVIAINGRLLRDVFPSLNGISQFPNAVEAVFPIGCQQIHLDIKTMKSVGSSYRFKPKITNLNDATVMTDIFMNHNYSGVSAIWAADFDENIFLKKSLEICLVHNPFASQPLPSQYLPANQEFMIEIGDSTNSLKWIDGLRPFTQITQS